MEKKKKFVRFNEEIINSENLKAKPFYQPNKKSIKFLKIRSLLRKLLREGASSQAFEIFENLDEKLREKILNFRDYDFFPQIIDHISYEEFKKIANYLSQENLRKMAIAKEGLAFQIVIGSHSQNIDMKKEVFEDMTKKIQFFLEIDDEYFEKIFDNKIQWPFKSKEMEEIFNKIRFIGEKKKTL